MKQITINIPDNCELKQDGNTYTIVEKEKKVTYYDIARKLFADKDNIIYIGNCGDIYRAKIKNILNCNICTSEKQAKKLLAINQLMNVAKYLNGDWQPDWNDTNDYKYFIAPNHNTGTFDIDEDVIYQNSYIYFQSEEVAQQAIEILGEETIKLALCTDY